MSVIFNMGLIIDPTSCCIKPFQDLEQHLTETGRMEESERERKRRRKRGNEKGREEKKGERKREQKTEERREED